MDVIRIWLGPLNTGVCKFVSWLRTMTSIALIFLITIQIGFRYLFICKWKRMRIIKDDLIVRLVSFTCQLQISWWIWESPFSRWWVLYKENFLDGEFYTRKTSLCMFWVLRQLYKLKNCWKFCWIFLYNCSNNL